jgi:hypothetical protein
MVYSELFDNVLEALNLSLEKCVAEIQLPGNIIKPVLTWLAIGDFHPII